MEKEVQTHLMHHQRFGEGERDEATEPRPRTSSEHEVPIEPAHKTNDIHSRCRGHVLEIRFFLPDRAGAAQAHHANALRNGSFHASAARIERFEVFRFGAL
jgi:hypothetical protein